MSVEEKYYNEGYNTGEYGVRELEHTQEQKCLSKMLDKYQAKRKKKCLEIGSGGGVLQDLVEDYTGFDLADIIINHLFRAQQQICQ